MAAGEGSKALVRAPELPFPIFRLSSRRPKYMLYDINTVTWLRSTHHILGVQIGGMPQFPQQNIFFGLPLELMPEEAYLLVEKCLAYVVDDLEMHNGIFTGLAKGDRKIKDAVEDYQRGISETAKLSEEESARLKAAEAERARERTGSKRSEKIEPVSPTVWNAARLPRIGSDGFVTRESSTDSTTPSAKVEPIRQTSHANTGWSATPTTASSLIQVAQSASNQHVQVSAATYAVYKHLHAKGYFMSPGLRFGCQLMAYPGDPLRFHSHFLCSGAGWDEEFDLLDIVGGGRLGTGVKKGYLLGGVQDDNDQDSQTRTFCIEWGGL